MLIFKGSNFFRQRLALSTITGKPIKIESIRVDDPLNPGLSEAETSLLHLLDSVTDGSKIKIDDTGTILNYTPGIIVGGGTLDKPLLHKCHPSRALSYYLEFLLLIIPFGRDQLYMKLAGVTDNDGTDHSVDIIKMVTIPLMQRLIPQLKDISLSILRRSVSRETLGYISFNIPTIYKIEPILMSENTGRVKRVRGVAWYTDSTSSQIAMKMISMARSVMNKFIPDVWIYLDKPKKENFTNDETAGFGMTLVSESLKGVIKGSNCSCIPTINSVQEKLLISFKNLQQEISTELNFKDHQNSELKIEKNDTEMRSKNFIHELNTENASVSELYRSFDKFNEMTDWEKIGWLTATRLLLEIDSQSSVDTSHQIYPLLFMSLSQDSKISKLKLSKLAPITIQFLRDLKVFTNVEFSIKQDTDTNNSLILSCTGIGLSNFSRRAK